MKYQKPSIITNTNWRIAWIKEVTHELVSLPKNTRKYRSFLSYILRYALHPQSVFKFRICEGIFTMAFRTNITFVDAKLTLDDVPAVEAFAKQFKGNVANLLTKLAGDGYTVKIGFYPDKASFAVFVAPDKDNKNNRNKMLSSWSDDVEEALYMSGFKHYQMFEGGEWVVDEKRANWG